MWQTTLSPQQLTAVCEQYHIERLWLFGSALRPDFSPRSDIDMLVEFQAGERVGLFKLAEIQTVLSELYQRHIDLSTPNSISSYIREKVLASAQLIYERS